MVRVEIVQVLIILLLAVIIVQCDVVIEVSTIIRIRIVHGSTPATVVLRVRWTGRRMVVELLQICSSTVVIIIRTAVVVQRRLLLTARRKLGHVQREEHRGGMLLLHIQKHL